MKRRTLLAGAGISFSAFAGCLSERSATDGDGRSDQTCSAIEDDVEVGNEPGESFPTVTLEADELGVDHLEVSVDLLRHFDTEAPAKFRITVMNDSDEEQILTFLMMQPFPPVAGHHTETGSMLFIDPDEYSGMEVPDDPQNGCWGVEEGYDISDVEDVATVEPCEDISREYGVYSSLGNSECLEEGEYRFETQDMGEQGNDWGFSLFLSYR